MDELMQQDYAVWDDNTFKTQNALEAANSFEATLDSPVNVGVIDFDLAENVINNMQVGYLLDHDV